MNSSPFSNISRITPAYAGKSFAYAEAFAVAEDHPRLCGEKLDKMRLYKPDSGSPPPMRGKVLAVGRWANGGGITPAYAGKSGDLVGVRDLTQDHPRLCGEKEPQLQQCRGRRGSPPPMRGKDSFSIVPPITGRITPAYAGKSFVLRSCRPCWRDHPRLCGEKNHVKGRLTLTTGSPPPMRGKGGKLRLLFENFGITPAYAGKST